MKSTCSEPSARASDYDKANGRVSYAAAIHGDMLRGDSLYVKWRIKATQVVYEDTVDLKSSLPRNIYDNAIHFTIKKDQLFVYLVTTERRPPEMPPLGPSYSNYRKTILLSSNIGKVVANP